MIIKGQVYNFVNEKTTDGVIYTLFRKDGDKHGHGLDDLIAISRPVGEEIDIEMLAAPSNSRASIIARRTRPNPALPPQSKNGREVALAQMNDKAVTRADWANIDKVL